MSTGQMEVDSRAEIILKRLDPAVDFRELVIPRLHPLICKIIVERNHRDSGFGNFIISIIVGPFDALECLHRRHLSKGRSSC